MIEKKIETHTYEHYIAKDDNGNIIKDRWGKNAKFLTEAEAQEAYEYNKIKDKIDLWVKTNHKSETVPDNGLFKNGNRHGFFRINNDEDFECAVHYFREYYSPFIAKDEENLRVIPYGEWFYIMHSDYDKFKSNHLFCTWDTIVNNLIKDKNFIDEYIESVTKEFADEKYSGEKYNAEYRINIWTYLNGDNNITPESVTNFFRNKMPYMLSGGTVDLIKVTTGDKDPKTNEWKEKIVFKA